MDWLEQVRDKLRRKNQILFSPNSDFLQDLTRLIGEQNHQTMVFWALEFAEETAKTLRVRYPNEHRPEMAVATAWAWAGGKAKMPEAQRAILNVHAVAKEISSPEDIALCHAIGQACGVVHTAGHAIGFPIYELTAIVRRTGADMCREPVERRRQQYMDRLIYWRDNHQNRPFAWAGFMLAD